MARKCIITTTRICEIVIVCSNAPATDVIFIVAIVLNASANFRLSHPDHRIACHDPQIRANSARRWCQIAQHSFLGFARHVVVCGSITWSRRLGVLVVGSRCRRHLCCIDGDTPDICRTCAAHWSAIIGGYIVVKRWKHHHGCHIIGSKRRHASAHP